MVDMLVPLQAGPERSVAATKSFITAMSAALGLVAGWNGDPSLMAAVADLPHQLQMAWDADWGEAVEPIASSQHLFVLGRDLTLGIAGEAALKLKETSALHAEAFSLAEVAHGPMALVGPDVPVLAFLSEAAIAGGAVDLVSSFQARGARVMAAGAEVPGAVILPVAPAAPAVRPILTIESFYRLADATARARGRDPDHPPSLSKVTETL
jgi:glucosamine--fructose-6-phosphate aminotransferase (isomerizing)